jgi:2-methylcitrate dehydratase PrpD
MNHSVPTSTPVAVKLAAFAEEAAPPSAVADVCRRLIFDSIGLSIAARHTDYVRAALASAVDEGSCTAYGHDRGLGLYDAALVNGTAAHGEDYDDTFEGGPIHAGAVIVSAVLAIAEKRGLAGKAVMRGIAVGCELMCRMSLVAPQATHKAGFHPTAIFGAPAAAAAVGAALGLDAATIGRALGISGSLASGIIEYLADGSSTKRLHAGAAAQAGLRAALLAEGGFTGPITVFDGSHGFYKAFAPSKTPDFAPLLDGLGKTWILETLAFKPYACGTMTQPFIDCAKKLAAAGVLPADIVSITCRAVGFLDGEAGLGQFTDERVKDPEVRALAAKISYEIDPNDPYPKNFTGHLKATLKNGTVHELRQAYMRGGAHEPLPDAELASKFEANLRFGGFDNDKIATLRATLDQIADGSKVDLKAARA